MSKRVQNHIRFKKSGIKTDLTIIPLPACIIDSELNIIKSNKEWDEEIEKLLSSSEKKLIIKNKNELINTCSQIKDKFTSVKTTLEYFHSDEKVLFLNVLVKYIKTIGKQKFYLLYIENNFQYNRSIIDDFKEEFKRFYNNIPGAVYKYIVQPDGTSYFEYVSDGIEKVFGIEAKELMKDSSLMLNRIHPDDKDRITKSFLNCIKELTVWKDEYRIILSDNKTIWVEGHSTPIKGNNSSIIWYGYVRDITIEKEQVLQLRKLTTAVEQSSATIVITDLKGNIEYANKKFEETTGYTIEEVKGQHTRILKSGEKSSEEYKDLWKTITSGKSWKGEFHNRRKNGEYYWESAIISPIFNEKNEIINFLAVKDDITHQKEIELALQKSEQRYRRIFESINDIFYQTDENRSVITVSPSVQKVLGWKPEEIIGKKVIDFFNDKILEEKIYNELYSNGAVNDFEVTLKDKNYNTKILSLSAKVLYDENNKYIGTVGIIRDITQRKEIEAMIANQNAFLNSLLDSIPDIVFYKDFNSVYLGGNKAFFDFIGRTKEEIIGETDFDLYEIEKAKSFIESDKKIISENSKLTISIWDVDRYGNKVYLETIKTAYYDKFGKPLGIIGISRDRTESKKFIEALEESERYQKSLLENLSSGVIIIDPTTREIENLNPAAEKMIGSTREDLLGKKCCMFMCSKDEICPVENYDNNITQFETTIQRIDGGLLPIYKSVSPIIIKGKKKYIENFIDISEIKKLQEELRVSEEKYRLLAENVSDMIWVYDYEDEKYLYVNPSVYKIKGFSPEEFINLNLEDNISKECAEYIKIKNQERFKRFVEEKKQISYIDELIHIRKDGSTFEAETTSSFYFDPKTKHVNLIGVTRDISKRKEAERKLFKTNQELKELNAMKDKLFSIIAHDLRNPFSIIIGFIDLLKYNFDKYSPEKRVEIIDSLKNTTQRVYTLLENLLAWSKSQSNNLVLNPALYLAEDIITQLLNEVTPNSNKKYIRIETFYNFGQTIFADKQLLLTILRNLITNAIKFTPKDGKIKISINDEDNFTKISVEDTGIGIPEEEIPKIFNIDSKFRRKGTEGEPSSGLGLLLCKEFIEKHGGKIWVESEINKGSKFIFTLPKEN